MPLGWMITVSKLIEQPTAVSIEELARTTDASVAQDIARWQAGWPGLDWLEALVSTGQALKSGNGYPYSYFARARDVRPHLARPPHENIKWQTDPGDTVSEAWLGTTAIDLTPPMPSSPTSGSTSARGTRAERRKDVQPPR